MDLHLARNIEAFLALSGVVSWLPGCWLPSSHESIALQLDILNEENPKECLLMALAVTLPSRQLLAALKMALLDSAPRKACGLPVRFVTIGDRLACSVVMPKESGAREWLTVYSILARRLRHYSKGGYTR
ncbi:hypothetical protein [Paraburkholderia sediminicola]|uniref:hypothetical protein n=1 Tax=Paraburkholderia sediminicola TaxID=458836 RepID=UPI0038B90A8A